jgi:predicted alpha-1,2-mannosidase
MCFGIDRLRATLKIPFALTLSASLFLSAGSWAQHINHVDPFLGSGGGGNVFPGATLPFGMLKAGPDTGNNTANAGWTPNQLINGFSQTHVSGTGGGAKYGNILIQPTTGDVLPADHASARSNEQASPGYYGVTLKRYGVRVDIAGARRSALYRFTYPAAASANILIDAGHCLSSSWRKNENQSLVTSAVEIVSPTEVTGSTTVTGGWNQQPTSYTVYFSAILDTAATATGTWHDGTLHPASQREPETKEGHTGAWFSFATTRAGQVVQMKIGISFISRAQAKRNALTEIHGFDFAATKTSAELIWNRALAPISVEGASDDDLTQFYSALYHTMLMPTDRTGENPLFVSHEPSYDDFYAIWDTFRTSSPLLTLIAPERESGIVRSLVDLYRHEGWLPDARSGEYNGRVQGGSDADILLTDAYLQHVSGVDWETAYQAVKHDADVTSPQPIKQGRGDLDDWNRLGYLSIEGTDRPASKSMEYATDDYAVALFARGLGYKSDYIRYAQRAQNWKNLWDKNAHADGFTGFVWSRHRDGSWKANFDPMMTGTWGSDTFYEGNSWTYSTFVPQDVAGLINASGGRTRFIERMDTFFNIPGAYDVGNEPGFLAPYLYLWAGRPDRTQKMIRDIIARDYHSGTEGLPGNDDSGAMSSWFAFGKLGIYPIAGQDVYLIGSPAFRRASIRLPNGRLFVIETEGNSAGTPYISSATWNGKPYPRDWFTHEQLMQGGVLSLAMSPTPSQWGEMDPPPSISTAESAYAKLPNKS